PAGGTIDAGLKRYRIHRRRGSFSQYANITGHTRQSWRTVKHRCPEGGVEDWEEERLSLGNGAGAGGRTARCSCQNPHLPSLSLSTVCASSIRNRVRGKRNREHPLPPPCAPLSICVTERAGVYRKDPWVWIALGKSYGCQHHQPHDHPKR